MVNFQTAPSATNPSAAKMIHPQARTALAHLALPLRSFSRLANSKQRNARLRMKIAAKTKWAEATSPSVKVCWIGEHPSGIGVTPHLGALSRRFGRMVGKKTTRITATPATRLSQKSLVLGSPDR